MKTIGVLGGLGPQATMDFESRVHAVAQRLIPPDGNRGYPPMVVYYFRQPPVVTHADGSPIFPVQVNPALLEAAARLGAVADFLVITSNGVHMMQAPIEEAAGRPVLSMVDITLAEVRRRELRKVGVLEYYGSGVYQRPLEQLGIPYVVLPAEQQTQLNHAIHVYTEGRETAADRRVTEDAVAWLRAQGTDGIILGCTEIPLLLDPALDAPDLINPGALLAEAAVRHAVA
jgi:aspartate racemase